ncbi:MAG: AbrB/MazE/SpoVT family DNA-binding domain-containing protein [Acidobacteriota bacterium]
MTINPKAKPTVVSARSRKQRILAQRLEQEVRRLPDRAERTRLSSKGQVVLPLSVRLRRKWEPGIELTVEERPEGVLLRPVKPFAPTTFEEVEQILKYKGEPKTLREMDEAIAIGVKDRHARGRY